MKMKGCSTENSIGQATQSMKESEVDKLLIDTEMPRSLGLCLASSFQGYVELNGNYPNSSSSFCSAD
jgi:hypothetical protein